MPEPIQRSHAELVNMPTAEISRALEAGELQSLLEGTDPGGVVEPAEPVVEPQPHPGSADQGARPAQNLGQITDRAELRRMSHADVVKAQREGRLNELLGVR